MKTKSTIIFLLILIPIFVHAQKNITLSYNLKKGHQYSLAIKNNQTITMDMMGQSMTLKQISETVQEITIADVDESNNITLNLTYRKMKLNQNAMGMEINYDSEKPDESSNPMVQQVAASLNEIIGKTVSLEIDRFGNAIKNNMSEMLDNNQSLAGFETGMLNVYSDKPVTIGESWVVSLKPDPQSDFVINSTYKLEGIKGKTATVSFEGAITGTEMKGQKASIKGTMIGRSQVDTQTGWVLSSTLNQVIEMEMEQEGTKIPMKMNSVIEMNSK
jgi:hypothetical protein